MNTLFTTEQLAEAGVLVAAVVLGAVVPWKRRAWMRRAAERFDAFSRRPVAPILSVFLLSFAGCVIFSLLKGAPDPVVHDEFAYLLAGDTYAHFRLTNPTHRFWMHFESMHIFQQPTYMAKYPPGQGMALALGYLLIGDPILGVWLSAAAACAATVWALRAWMPPKWALGAGLLAVARCGIAEYWAQSYWGGAVAFLGGALLFGAIRRLAKCPSLGSACAMAIGVAILANSRPFEGLLASLAAAGALLVAFLRGSASSRTWLTRVVLPATLLLSITAAAMLHNNKVVTGSATRLPYWVHNDAYTIISQFAWVSPRPAPEYRHESMRRFYQDVELPYWTRQSTPAGFAHEVHRKVHQLAMSPCGMLIVLAVVVAFRAFRRGWWLYAALVVGGVWFAMLGLTIVFSHYAAPVAVLALALVVRALRVVRTWRPKGKLGGRAVLAGAVVMSALFVSWRAVTPGGVELWGRARAQVQDLLENAPENPERDLVIVTYGREHHPDFEWIYNRADIDASSVVWARDMGPERNRALREYFHDRTAWSLDIPRDEEQPIPRRLPRLEPK